MAPDPHQYLPGVERLEYRGRTDFPVFQAGFLGRPLFPVGTARLSIAPICSLKRAFPMTVEALEIGFEPRFRKFVVRPHLSFVFSGATLYIWSSESM